MRIRPHISACFSSHRVNDARPRCWIIGRRAKMDVSYQPEDSAACNRTATVVRKRHINWALKAVLPIAAVLLNGLLLFVLVSSSLAPGQRNDVIAVAAAGALVICVAVLMVLAVQVRRPMVELQEKFARVQLGDLDVAVSFADRNDEIGDLGNDFNDMVAQLKASREEITRLHQT